MTDVADCAWIDGQPASRAAATEAAAALLGGSRAAVVAGLGTDIAGARAAIALAQAIGGSIDHMAGDAMFTDLDVMRRVGWIVTTPLQTRARADTVLLVGDGLEAAWRDMSVRLALDAAPSLAPATSRRILRVDGRIGTLAALRAIAAGRRASLDIQTEARLRDLAAALAAARFGVAVWSAASMDTLAVEMLCGLIDDLNRTTRFAGLPLGAGENAEGVTQAAAWITGFPVRTGFAGASAAHDPWRFDAQRLVESCEADAAVWISALSPIPPPWRRNVPTVALVAPGTAFGVPPTVVMEVARPGMDHDAMLFETALGGIAFAAATASSAASPVSRTVAAIIAALPPC